MSSYATSYSSRVALRAEVFGLIKPYKTSPSKPQFSAEEMIAMALTLTTKGGMTKSEIQKWIMQSLKYYNDIGLAAACAIDEDLEYTPTHTDEDHEFMRFKMNFDDAMRKWDLPMEEYNPPPRDYYFSGSDYYDSDEDSEAEYGDPRKQKWAMEPAAARIVLRGRLQAGAKKINKPFPFMKLPAELRVRIYQLVLQQPKSGLFVLQHRYPTPSTGPALARVPPASFHGFSRSMNEPHKKEDRPDVCLHRDRYFARPTTGLDAPKVSLALLQVNKKVSEESLPVFFGENNFAREGLVDLADFLEATPPSRRTHIGHISFYYDQKGSKHAGRAFRLLKEIKHLRELDIWIAAGEWTREMKTVKSGGVNTQEPLYPDLLRIPGLATLRTITSLKAVRLHGDCEAFQPIVAGMTKREEKPKKRKSKAAVEDVGIAKTRKSRKSGAA